MSDFNLLEAYLELRFLKNKDQIMSEVSDKISEVSISFDAAHQRVMDAVQQLRDELEAVKANNPSPDDLAKLDALDAKIDALDPSNPTVLPEDPDGNVDSGPLPLPE